MTVLPNFRLGKVCFRGWCGFSGTDLEVVVMVGASALVWAAGALDDGRVALDSGDEVSIAGRVGESVSGTEIAAAIIGPGSAAEDTGATTVDVDAAVGVLDADNTGVEAVERTEKKRSSDPEDIFSLRQNGV